MISEQSSMLLWAVDGSNFAEVLQNESSAFCLSCARLSRDHDSLSEPRKESQNQSREKEGNRGMNGWMDGSMDEWMKEMK